ncbi:MAG: thioesterase family protein [Actinomycetia bacterium]|nr:thioesterase family protein [Actinomycetes bacterium]MCP4958526.1 thioesterase family protein [Actinomycetes bacterium]
MAELETGLVNTETYEVTDEMSPPHLPMKVLSTPDMVGLIEGTCLFGVQPHLPEGQTTVGIHVCVSHQAAVGTGEEVEIVATLAEVDRKKLTFDVRVTHGDTVVSEGTHQRFIVG